MKPPRYHYTIDADTIGRRTLFFVLFGRWRFGGWLTYIDAERAARYVIARRLRLRRRQPRVYRQTQHINAGRYRCECCGRSARRAADETVCAVCRDTSAGRIIALDYYRKRFGPFPQNVAAL
jgi:hypothetical protein